MKHRIRPLAASVALLFVGVAPAGAQTQQLDDVVVRADRIQPLPDAGMVSSTRQQQLRAASSDAASLLRDVPGVSLYGAGGVSSLPVIRGLADDRLRIKVDGMDLLASCPNHMNPPLSYLDPSRVDSLTVYAGIAPVSVGGDSIGGSIVAQSRAPEFAAPGQGNLLKGEIGAYYRSNNDARGLNAAATFATKNFSISYSGAVSAANDYTAGGNFKDFTATGRNDRNRHLDRDVVGSTSYLVRNHDLSLATRSGNHLFELKLGYQDMPEQNYPNQRMDLLDNEQKRVSLRYLGQLDWGRLEVQGYHEKTKHFMNFGEDKLYWYSPTTPGMPMKTEGETFGLSAKGEIDLGQESLLRVGAEYQHYTLDDWWPPSGTGGMSPYNFININDGERNRAALYGEWENRFSPQWLTLVGLRYEQVHTSAGKVHGYNRLDYPTTPTAGNMNQNRDAANFNNSDRSQTDHNIDLTALARWTLSPQQDIEFGLARKVRSPNLYERYTWSAWPMAAVMNNFVGDGNGYLGAPDLKPEKAYTASVTFDWHSVDRSSEVKLTPFYSYVNDFIDAVQWDSGNNRPNTTLTPRQFSVLRYQNQSARLYGLDLSGRLPLAATAVGAFGLQAVVNYTRGKNRDSGDDLYNIMPLNGKLILTHRIGGWDNALEVIGVTSKHKVSDQRNEIKTAGYGLVNLRASYSWQQVRLDFGVENLFDKFYDLPTGGAYVGQGRTMTINATPWGIAVPGMGRSLYAGVNVKF
ncbi:MAG: TonB-dependent receptor [Betaproteobacteria bacterium]|nr:TonB-dependent receptor [Betaproteobacteria bacterium]MCL2886459.1 TonB-dependent receptor [Betaproteobacteria bacterium]